MNVRTIIVNTGIIAVIASMFFSITGLSFLASSGTTNVVAQVNVPAACTLAVSNTAINFLTVTAGTGTGPANAVVDTNNGNVNSYIWVSGSNWMTTNGPILAGGNFFVSNTMFSNTFNSQALPANTLTIALENTFTIAPSFGSTNTEYFGVNIPNGQMANSYSQNILIQNVC